MAEKALPELVRDWQEARRALLQAINDEPWLKAGKKGTEVDPKPLMAYWIALANAEAALYTAKIIGD